MTAETSAYESPMRRVLTLLTLPLVLSACSTVDSYVQSTVAKLEHATNPSAPPRPGLEPLYRSPDSDPTRPAPLAAGPLQQPEPDDVPFPPRLIGHAEAEGLLAGDPAALRFLTIRRLAETGQISPEDAAARAAANLGALLPLTEPQPPAAGLFLPAPPPRDIERAMAATWTSPGGASQRAFMADNVLPLNPTQRQAMVVPDMQAARQALARLDRLNQAGLISGDQKQAEEQALRALMAGGSLPESLAALTPPPEPVQPAKPKKAGTGGSGASGSGSGRPMERLQGGVTGELKVIPSPLELTAPALPAGFTGQAGIHLLSMGSATHGEQAWKGLSTQHPELAALTYKVIRADLGELGVTHRLIAGPLSPANAAELCAALKPKGQSCTPTPFPP